MGIGDCFIKLINRIAVTDAEWKAVTVHADEIGIRLKKNFGITEVRRLGSHDRGTAIHTYSDLDLFMVVKKSEVTRATLVYCMDRRAVHRRASGGVGLVE